MTRIVKATTEDASLLAKIGKTSWVEAHGPSASPDDINYYVAKKYTESAILEELKKASNWYSIIYCDEKPAGYSNIIFNATDPNITTPHVAELDRLYLLREFYDRRLGWELLQFNIELAKKNRQTGIWLYVWDGNQRAIAFYTRAGFKVVGGHDFKISESHSNPNHQMLLML